MLQPDLRVNKLLLWFFGRCDTATPIPTTSHIDTIFLGDLVSFLNVKLQFPQGLPRIPSPHFNILCVFSDVFAVLHRFGNRGSLEL